MIKTIITLAAPPLAACKFGCAGCCAAPIGVFWLAGLASLVYGLFGGPTAAAGVSWATIGLGVALWVIAAVWSWLVIRGADADKCADRTSSLCSTIMPSVEDGDPFEEVHRSR